DVRLATGTLALITMEGVDGRTATLGPHSIAALEEALTSCAARVGEGELSAVALTGAEGCFAAGADLRAIGSIRDAEDARHVAEAGHRIVAALRSLPSFALVNGLALGGGLELALACRYRVAAADAAPLGLSETFLGPVPGWGGCYLLPRLIGPEAAPRVIIDDHPPPRTLTAQQARVPGGGGCYRLRRLSGPAAPLRVIIDNPPRERTRSAQQALDVGVVDAVQRGSEEGFRDGALACVAAVLSGAISPERTDHTVDAG